MPGPPQEIREIGKDGQEIREIGRDGEVAVESGGLWGEGGLLG